MWSQLGQENKQSDESPVNAVKSSVWEQRLHVIRSQNKCNCILLNLLRKKKLFTVTNHKEVTTKYIIFGKKPYWPFFHIYRSWLAKLLMCSISTKLLSSLSASNQLELVNVAMQCKCWLLNANWFSMWQVFFKLGKLNCFSSSHMDLDICCMFYYF